VTVTDPPVDAVDVEAVVAEVVVVVAVVAVAVAAQENEHRVFESNSFSLNSPV
jgi:hypothetical protein